MTLMLLSFFLFFHPKASWFREPKAKKQPSKMRQMGGFLLRALPEPQPAELERSTPVPESTEVTFINNTPLTAKTKNNLVFRLLRVLSIFHGHKHCYFSLQPRKHCGGRVMRVPALWSAGAAPRPWYKYILCQLEMIHKGNSTVCSLW